MDMIRTTLWMASGWGAGLLLLGLACLGYFAYLLLRHRRYRVPTGPELSARVEGWLVGRMGALAYRTGSGPVARASEVLLIEQGGRSVPVISGPEARGLRAGAFVTADGTPATLVRGESPYRELDGGPALVAERILVGYWPELRWLRLPVAIGCLIWTVGLTCWLFAPTPQSPLFSHSPVESVMPIHR